MQEVTQKVAHGKGIYHKDAIKSCQIVRPFMLKINYLMVFFVFHSQMFDQVGFLWRFKVAKCAGIQHIFGIMGLHV